MCENLTQPSSSVESAETVESFYGVYVLYCVNPKYKGRTYIGYTVNPNRRINQHNKGVMFGGARRTNNRGPWEMVLIVHGFPNDISALRFEWAWQHPDRSRRLKCIEKKKYKENQYRYRLRILSEMLRMGPWCKLPLTVRWLNEQFQVDFLADQCPPVHMPVVAGPVKTRKLDPMSDPELEELFDCHLCSETVEREDLVTCVKPRCLLVAHIICLADHFLRTSQETQVEEILPVEGMCPQCGTQILWGDIIRKKKGCYKDLSEEPL